MQLTVEHIAYHRNGICGAPFHVLLFCDPDEGQMLGVVFEAEHHVAVFNLDKLALGNIAFGVNSWRGDRYEPNLRRLIQESIPAIQHPRQMPDGTSPEPWTATYDPTAGLDGEDVPGWEIYDRDGYTVARTEGGSDPNLQAADARLIAEAPALLRSLRRAVAALNTVPAFTTDEGISSYRLLPELDAVIRQATKEANGTEAAHG